MDENALRDMLERATREEPPMGRLPIDALRKGIRLRRRRRAQSAATAAVAAVAVVAVVPTLATHGNVATSAQGTAYVAAWPNRIVPVNLATDTAGRSIPVATFESRTPMALAPNGRTLYVTSPAGLVTPIDTKTDKAGPPINLHVQQLGAITLTPNGLTAYVVAATGVVPVDLATRKVQRMIRTPYAERVVVAPSGKFAYVEGQQDVIPIRVATDTALRPIQVAWDEGIIFSADGRTAYALSEHDKQRLGELIPISTTTSAVGRLIHLGFQANTVVGIPHSRLAYLEEDKGPVVPVNLVTGRVGKAIDIDAFPGVLVAAPDGKAVYAFSSYSISATRSGFQLTEISTVRDTVVRDVHIKGLSFELLAISPDGSTGLVTAGEGSLTDMTEQLVPIHLANNTPGRPVQFGHRLPVAVVFAG